MIERGDNDFVAGLQIAANRPGERERDGGHVLAEDDFVAVAIEEVGHGGTSRSDRGVVAAAGFERATSVGVRVEEVILDGVHHLFRNLRASGAVEECGWVAIYLEFQRRELFSYPSAVERLAGGFVEGGSAHGVHCPWRCFELRTGSFSQSVCVCVVVRFEEGAIGVEARLEMLHGAVTDDGVRVWATRARTRNAIAAERRAKAQRLHTYRKTPTRRAIRSKLVVDSSSRFRQIHLAKIRAW